MVLKKNLTELPDLFSPKDLQYFMGISKQTAYNLINSHGFPVLRLGKKILIPKEDYKEWLKKNTSGLRSE